jgi:hypothetical protein
MVKKIKIIYSKVRIDEFHNHHNGPGWYEIYWVDGSYTSILASQFIEWLWPIESECLT